MQTQDTRRSATSVGEVPFGDLVTHDADERLQVEQTLSVLTPDIRVRGLFFEGLSRLISQMRGEAALKELWTHAGVSSKTTAFKFYPHRDFYRLYFLAARLLGGTQPLARSMRETAQHFFPIFKASLVGKTMSALMGDDPRTLLPLLARAYNVVVEGNEHAVQLTGASEAVWTGRAENHVFYPEIFRGILEGAMRRGAHFNITLAETQNLGNVARYTFRLAW